MPLYEYQCGACGERFELLRSLSNASEVVCHRCHSADVKRLLSVFAVHSGTSSRAGSSPSSASEGSSAGGCCGGGCGCCGH
jgi:putative FmdB family regulatory protein